MATTGSLIAVFGERPHVNTAAQLDIRQWTETLVEPADRMTLVAWIALAAILALVGLAQVRNGRRRGSHEMRSAAVLTFVAAGLVLASAAWSEDPLRMWFGFGAGPLCLGAILAVVALNNAAHRGRPIRVAAMPILVLILALAVPTWFQTPNALIDAYDFKFVSEELTSVAAGHFPLSDYVPQYSVLLPFLFAPALALQPGMAPALVLTGILLLQVVCLAIAVLMPAAIGGRRLAPVAAIIVLPTAFVTLSNGYTPASYFQSFPLRYFLPMLAIAVTVFALRNQPRVSWRHPGRWWGIGVLCGVTGLNNPDFGLAAAVAILVGLAVATRPLIQSVMAVVLAVAGALVVPAGYAAVGQLNGTSVDWASWLQFPLIFGSSGYMNLPLPSYGLQVAIVALSVITAGIGFILLWGSDRPRSEFRFRQGILLLLLGLWSLATLPYLIGRSVPAVFVQGYSVLAATMVAAMLPLTAILWQRLRSETRQWRDACAVLLPFLAVSICVACLFHTVIPTLRQPANPGKPWDRFELMAGQHDELMAAEGVAGTSVSLRSVLRDGRVVQALDTANLTALVYGMPSVAVSSSVEYINLSRTFARIQCARPLPGDADYLLLVADNARYLAEEPGCDGYADWSRAQLYRSQASGTAPAKEPRTFALVPIRR